VCPDLCAVVYWANTTRFKYQFSFLAEPFHYFKVFLTHLTGLWFLNALRSNYDISCLKVTK